MAVLQECELLKIEDILPFFPDFVTIDHFQADICKSLQTYNRDIESLKEEMDNATQSARAIRADIQQLRNKCGVVQGSAVCGICAYPLLTRPFYLFPCNHGFHSDCMATEVRPYHFACPLALPAPVILLSFASLFASRKNWPTPLLNVPATNHP